MIKETTANRLQEYPRLKITGNNQQKQKAEVSVKYRREVNFKNY